MPANRAWLAFVRSAVGVAVVYFAGGLLMRTASTWTSLWASSLSLRRVESLKKARSAFAIARRIEVPSAVSFACCDPHLRCFHVMRIL